MSAIVVALRTGLVRIGFRLGSLAGRRRRILFATAHADRIGGNLAFLRRDVARRRPREEVAIFAHRATAGWRGRLGGAIAALGAGWAVARATVIVVDDYFFALYVVPSSAERFVVQTWHASGAFKRFGHSVNDASFGADAALRSRVRIHGTYDVCLVGSEEAAVHYAEAFDLPIDRFCWDLGIPRTDIFFGEAAIAAATDVRERYRVPDDRSIVLWAPTFRGDRVTEARYDPSLDLHALRRAIGDSHFVLLRLHPFVSARLDLSADLRTFVVDASDHPDINALMLVSDALVTDYSSAIFEFSLLERPMGFFAPDLEAYERERGFYVDYRSWVPGPVLETTDDVAGWLRAGRFDLETVRRFRDRSFAVADGEASRRVVDDVLLPALDGRRPTVSRRGVRDRDPIDDSDAPARGPGDSARLHP